MSDKREFSRAELVRKRREKEHAQHLHRASKVSARSVVVTRARKDLTKPIRKPAKRRFQIALPHLPSMPRMHMPSISIARPRVGWRLFSFVFAAILGLAIYFAFNRPELRATEARLYGNVQLTQAEVNTILNVTGQPIFLLIPSDLETRLRLNYPELASVRVNVALPNIVAVNVIERQAIIRWEQGGGYTWISEDGIAFRPRGELVGLIPVVALSAPPVDGLESDPLTPTPFISTDMVLALKGLYGHVPPGTSIIYEKDYGFGWNDPRGWRVYFGTNASDVALKIRVYESMVDSLTQRGIRPALINVMHPTAPYYRMSQ